jgi:putative transposase
MKLCVKYRLKPTKEQTETLEKLAFYATKLYNTDNWIRRETWAKTGKIPNWYAQKKLLKTNHWYQLLPSQTAQAVIKNLQDNYESWFKLRKTDPAAKPPGFRSKDKLSPLTFYQQFSLDGGQLTLVMSRKFRAETGVDKLVFHVSLWRKVDGAPKMCTVLYQDGKWMAHLVYEVQEPPRTNDENVMAVDSGIVNLAATVDLAGHSKLYSGRQALSVQHYFNKEIARVQSLTAKQQNKKGSRAISRMYQKKTRQVNQILHSVSKALVEDAKRNHVGTIVVGDLKNIRKDNGKAKDWGRNNQKLHAWGFRKLLTQIRYKAALSGIRVVEVSERNTSRRCSKCGLVRKANRVHRGLYRCKRCGSIMNADVNAAVNLLKKYLHQAKAEGSIGFVAEPLIWRYAVNQEAHTL